MFTAAGCRESNLPLLPSWNFLFDNFTKFYKNEVQNKASKGHNMHKSSYPYKSLEKGLKILLAFEFQNRELSIVALSELLGLHRSTVGRIVKILVAYDFLQQNPQTRKLSLGPTNILLAKSLKRSLRSDLVQTVKPYLDELRDKLQDTVILETLSLNNWIMAYVTEGAGRIRLVADIGERMPIHAAAGGKAFLAFSTAEVRASLLNCKLAKLTKNTITDRKKLERQFSNVRAQGFAFDCGEYDEGIHAVSVPIFDYEGKPIASATVAGTPQRITGLENSSVVLELKKTGRKISKRFGYKGMA